MREVVNGRRLLSVPAHVATKVADLRTGLTASRAVRTRQELLNLLAVAGLP